MYAEAAFAYALENGWSLFFNKIAGLKHATLLKRYSGLCVFL